jgi:ferrochelatase
VPLVVCPIVFVSEHSETLVEIELEYRHMAHQAGVPAFFRVPAVGTAAPFIDALAALVRGALQRPVGISPSGAVAICPHDRTCPVARVAA